jgi:hypothetical protein
LEDIRDFSTAAFGSDLCSRGRWAGITPTTFTLITLTADITCTTRIIPTLAFRSASYCNYLAQPAAGVVMIRTDRTASAALAAPGSFVAALNGWKKEKKCSERS